MADETTIGLLEPILDQGNKNTNFFNGRLLSAEDLQTEQQANRYQHEQIRRALGEGIVEGLEVSRLTDGADGTPPQLKITAGLAFNRKGQAVELPHDVHIVLARQTESPTPQAGLFEVCKHPAPSRNPQIPGIFILLVSPTSGYREKVPVQGFSDSKTIGCGDRYAVEGVEFRLEEISLNDLDEIVDEGTPDKLKALMKNSDPASLSKLRNWLAHICFGTEEWARAFARNPLAPINDISSQPLHYGVIDILRSKQGRLTDCEVPLALLYWTNSGVKFVDMWAVRRSLAAIPVCLHSFKSGDNNPNLAMAMILQFQVQIDELIAQDKLQAFQSTPWIAGLFRYLPPFGAIPTTESGEAGGFTLEIFMQGLHSRGPYYIEGANIEPLYRDAFSCPPIDLLAGKFFWLYRVREIAQARAASSSVTPPDSFVFFASGHLSYRGDARFNQAHWNYSNLASLPVF